MLLARMAWPDVEQYLTKSKGIIIPVGSTEQHGPMGMIGTDTICAEAVATAAAAICGALVAPAIAYTPAPFNTAFPGTLSVSAGTFKRVLSEILHGLRTQGFRSIYVVNGHGANIEPLNEVATTMADTEVFIRSWWEYPLVQELRSAFFAGWEGMHATPSEISITQALLDTLPARNAASPPKKLDEAYIRAHAGDRHGPPDEHRANFPDGRVGSHSALAKPEYGKRLLDAAAASAAKEYQSFLDNGISLTR